MSRRKVSAAKRKQYHEQLVAFWDGGYMEFVGTATYGTDEDGNAICVEVRDAQGVRVEPAKIDKLDNSKEGAQ